MSLSDFAVNSAIDLKWNKHFVAVVALAASLSGCGGTSPVVPSSTKPATGVGSVTGGKNPQQRLADLHVVDCMLPGQVRMLGNRSYMTPRRPATLTAAECRARGGEYVAYDRADLSTSLSVWMPSAEAGDAEAQARVGEIFERGPGGTPDYKSAALWYRKAAEQGNKSAQFNLGTLYEQGFGVEQDPLQALNWYRQAWGLPQDSVIYQSALEKQRAELLQRLNSELRKKDLQIQSLQQRIDSLKKQSDASSGEARQQIQELESLVEELQVASQSSRQHKQALEARAGEFKLREPGARVSPTTAQTLPGASRALVEAGINFGKYYALVIGVEHYQNIENLDTPVNDTNKIADILSQDYGFNVTKIIDADNIAVMEAINNINTQLTEEDNLLIFYAGHGARLQTGDIETGFWLPSNADAPPRDTFWVANEFVTRHLSRIKAKRVLVVADSCYAGLLSSAPGFLMLDRDIDFSPEYIKYKAARRSRLLLTSGGDKPVLDGNGDKNSIFTTAFIDVLKQNDMILTAPQLFKQVRARVTAAAKKINFSQQPEYKAIKGAGHEVGDFFFLPQKMSLSAQLR